VTSLLKKPAQTILLVAVMVAIFMLDTFSDYEIAIAVFYTLVILAALRWHAAREVIILTMICIGLTVLSFILTLGGQYDTGLVNTIISSTAIIISALLGLRMRAAQHAAHVAREELLRISRATGVGYLTASIAHEIGQPLTAIMSSGDACRRWLNQQPPQPDKAQRALQRMLTETRRASDIIERIRAMVRGEAVQPQAFDVNQAVREMLQLCAGECSRRNINLQLYLAAHLPPVWFDRVQLQQILGNLVLNAMDSITAVPEQPHPGLIRIRTQMDDGAVLLSVGDNGMGFVADAREHLFDAFWSSKQGTMGLGLTLCRQMAESHGAQLWADAAQGFHQQRGAVFYLRLPMD